MSPTTEDYLFRYPVHNPKMKSLFQQKIQKPLPRIEFLVVDNQLHLVHTSFSQPASCALRPITLPAGILSTQTFKGHRVA